MKTRAPKANQNAELAVGCGIFSNESNSIKWQPEGPFRPKFFSHLCDSTCRDCPCSIVLLVRRSGFQNLHPNHELVCEQVSWIPPYRWSSQLSMRCLERVQRHVESLFVMFCRSKPQTRFNGNYVLTDFDMVYKDTMCRGVPP